MDLRLKDSTASEHTNIARRFLGEEKDLGELTAEDIRSYLSTHTHLDPSTYSNVVKSLRRFIRDFLERPELMKTFKLPYVPFKPSMVSTKES